jgi:hypothetical protein
MTMGAKTVSEKTHEATMKVLIVQGDEGQDPRFSVDYGGMKMMNLGNRGVTFATAREAQEGADLAVSLTGHRCYWACSDWS